MHGEAGVVGVVSTVGQFERQVEVAVLRHQQGLGPSKGSIIVMWCQQECRSGAELRLRESEVDIKLGDAGVIFSTLFFKGNLLKTESKAELQTGNLTQHSRRSFMTPRMQRSQEKPFRVSKVRPTAAEVSLSNANIGRSYLNLAVPVGGAELLVLLPWAVWVVQTTGSD